MTKEEEKPVEQWTAVEWSAAYEALNAKFERMRDHMRRAIQTLSNAI